METLKNYERPELSASTVALVCSSLQLI